MKNTIKSGHESARSVVVWDPLVRLIHWGVALTILLNSTIVDDDSDLHKWLGYIAVGLVCVRLVWGIVGPRYAKFTAFPPNPFTAIQHLKTMFNDKKTVHLSHNPLGALMVYNIWLSIILIAITGYMMGTVMFFGIEWVEEVHELIFGWLIFSIVLHIGGVLLDSKLTGVRLVVSMISGRKNIPKNRQTK